MSAGTDRRRSSLARPRLNLRSRLEAIRELPPTMIIGGLLLLAHIVMALVGIVWTPYPMSKIGTGATFAPPTWEHLFGTDALGRDVFSRVMYGGHIVLVLSLSGTMLGAIIGVMVGLVSAYVGGWLDEIMMRLTDALVSIPFLMLALLFIAAAGPENMGSPLLLMLVVTLLYAPRMARMARAAGIEVVTRDFVALARTRGESSWSIIRREVLPNTSGTLLVEFAVRLGNAPLVIGSLGFLGFGLRPPTPEWGLMISEHRNYLMIAPAIILGPAFVLASFVIGANLFTDGLARILGHTVHRVPK
jgi:peptide/nickel transport system permease protein